MACCRLCPTDALDTRLTNPEKVLMGRARIDTSICYSHLFLDLDAVPDQSGMKIGALCNTCYNVCPLQGKAIELKGNLAPVVLDGCVGCGICVEKCPTRPKRAINVVPTGMGKIDEAGFYFRKARKQLQETLTLEKKRPAKAFKGLELLEQKQRIDGSRAVPKFNFPYEIERKIEDWD
jgi:ferredoxin-type protein NapG